MTEDCVNITQLKCGAGSAEIIFSNDMFPTEGFNSIHDNPHVRVLLIEGNIKLAIVAIELVVVAKPFVADIKKIINEACGVEEENIWVHGTHAISTPHAPGPKPIGPPELRKQPTEEEKIKRALFTEALNIAAKEAAVKAQAKIVPAKMGFGTAECDVNCSSRVLDKERGMMNDIDGMDVSDKNLNILRFDDLNGNPIAFLLNYCLMSNAIDNSEMKKGTRQVSSDVPGMACSILEAEFGVPVLFTMAAGADQKPHEQAMYFAKDSDGNRIEVDKGVAYGLQLVEKFGTELADCAIALAESIQCSETSPIIKTAVSSVTVENRPRGNGGPGGPGPANAKKEPEGGHKGPDFAELTVLAARIGNVALVATNPELCCETELELKEQSPYEFTLLISFTDGPKGIMADKKSFSKECGEGRSSFAVEGSAEKFVEKALETLRTL